MGTDLAGGRILVVDDDRVNRMLLTRSLEREGHRVRCAENGAEALELLHDDPCDVVLVDVEMPEMDGLEAARRIQRDWTAAERPRLIAMTANAMQGDRETCLAAGIDDYVGKPVHLDSLAEALSRCAPRAVLDSQALEHLRATPADREFAAELVDAYLRDAPALLETLRGPDARRAAHTLKSTARVLGAARLAELCQEREALATADRLGDAAGLLSRIDAEHARVGRAPQELT
jgi:CheY-like chemotaxis protein